MKVISILEGAGFRGILAILDADFDLLENNISYSHNVVLTDTHDLETMMIKTSAFEKVLGEFGSEEKIAKMMQDTGKDIRAILLACSLPIGCLRWVSLRDRLSLKFEGLDYSQFIHKEKLSLDQTRFIQVVKNKSQRHDISDTKINDYMQAVKDDNHDPWHVCCGHDLMQVLSVGLHKAIGTWSTNDVKPDVLERSLRLAFEHSHFYKTRLYVSIQQWEKLNLPFIILNARE